MAAGTTRRRDAAEDSGRGTDEVVPTAVFAWGNLDRTDDAAGGEIAERLRARIGDRDDVRIEISWLLSPEMAETMARYPRVLFIDAHVDVGDGPGLRLRRVEPAADAEVAITHQMPPGDLLALCRDVYGEQPETWLLTVRAHSLEFGRGLTPATAGLVDDAVETAVGFLGIAPPAD